jgi:hypothetical protein
VLSGPDELRRAALQSVLQWHYDPAKRAPGKATVSIHYRLPKEEEAELQELRKKSEIAAPGTDEKAILDKQVAELQSKLQNEGPSTRRQMEGNLAALRSKKEMAAPGSETKVFLEKEIAELESRLQNPESAEAARRLWFSDSSISGTLRSIRSERVSPSARSEILNRLPVHIGDEINQESAKKIREVLNTVDEHLTMRWVSEQGNLSLLIGVESDGVNPQGVEFRGVPQGVEFRGVPQGVEFRGVPQGVEFRGAPYEYRSSPAPVK